MAHSAFSRRLLPVLLAVLLLAVLVLPGSAFLFGNDEDLAALTGKTETVENSAPIAENLTLTTYKNIAIQGTCTATDPDGDQVTFRVVNTPARGAVTLSEDGSGLFTYSPYENKTGKDSFSYVAEDATGNVSEPATVKIKIEKAKTKVTYADMEGNPAHRAAIRLAEKGIMVSECLSGTYFFRPDATMTRAEFLALAMDTVGLEPSAETLATGFGDDAAIATWARPYVTAALQAGMLQGSLNDSGYTVFRGNAPITRLEAAVLLNRLLRVSDVSVQSVFAADNAAVPTWASQATINLQAVGVLSSTSGVTDLSTDLTRAQCAEMLSAALDVIAARK